MDFIGVRPNHLWITPELATTSLTESQIWAGASQHSTHSVKSLDTGQQITSTSPHVNLSFSSCALKFSFIPGWWMQKRYMGDAHWVHGFLERIFSLWKCDLNKPLGVFQSKGSHNTGTFTRENSSGEHAKLAGDVFSGGLKVIRIPLLLDFTSICRGKATGEEKHCRAI